MAVAAKKNEYVYAPSRVYSKSRAATAEALPLEPQWESPAPAEPAPAPAPRRNPEPRVKTRVHRGVSAKAQRKQRVVPVVMSVVGIFFIAAVLIGVIVRYSAIALAYSAVNDLQNSIEESERNIAALNVQLNNAMSIEQAQAVAAEAGLTYPTAEQIVPVRETIGSYQKKDAADAQPGDTDGGSDTDTSTTPDGGENDVG